MTKIASLLVIVGILAMSGESNAANRYWDTTAGTGNGVGGSATWSNQNSNLWSTTSTGDATLTSAAITDAGIFEGTAGTVTFSNSMQLASWTFNTTNYVLTTSTATNGTQLGSFTLAASVNLNFGDATDTGSHTLSIGGSISGGSGSTITIQGNQASSATSGGFGLRLSTNNTTISVPIVINQSGSGVAGVVAAATGVQITGTITNNGTGATMLGALQNNDLTVSGVISGTAAVRFQGDLGTGNAGAGTVTLTAQNTYTGATIINMASSGTVKLGIDDALSTTSALKFGAASTSNNVGSLDMNGKNQTIASLESVTTGTHNIKNTSATLSTLTINGSAVTSYTGTIGALSANNMALTLASTNTGTLTLSGINTYTGGTNVNGGTLILGNVTNTLADTGAVTVGGGTLSIGANSDTVGVVTLTSGNITGTTGVLTGSSYDVRSGSVSAALGGTGVTLTKSTSGTVTLSGGSANTYTGKTTVSAGTLALNKTAGVNAISSTGATGATAANTDLQITGGSVRLDANNQIVDTAKLGLSGGTFNLNGKSEGAATTTIGVTTTAATPGLGALTLSATSIIDFGAGDNNNKLVFSGVDSHTAGQILQITNWDGIPFTGSGSEQLLFSGTSTAFTSIYDQADVSFNSIAGYAAIQFTGFYEITAIPEPSTWAAGALALGGLICSQRRRFSRIFKRAP